MDSKLTDAVRISTEFTSLTEISIDFLKEKKQKQKKRKGKDVHFRDIVFGGKGIKIVPSKQARLLADCHPTFPTFLT